MLDLILLIFLCIRIKNIVKPKGYNVTGWVLRTVGAWMFCEIAGIMLSYMVQRDFLILNLSGFLCAVAGYLYVHYKAVQLPDKNKVSHWSDRLGGDEEQ